MRPELHHDNTSTTFTISKLGLSSSQTLTYNFRQMLPMSDCDRHEVKSNTFPSPEAAMKSARQKPPSISSPNASCGIVPPGEETRHQRLERIKQEIQNGTYDTDEKLEMAVDRMIGRWRGE